MLPRFAAPIAAATLVLVAGCGLQPAPAAGSGNRVEVVAAENFWGSIIAQVGGERVHVVSIVSNPDTDPHAYEARPDDARSIAQARYVVSNGAGYDPWVPKLLAANPVAGRRDMVVADLLGKKAGDNPHFWYSPAFLDRVINRVTADLQTIDPADAAYFQQQNRAYREVSLKPYRETIAAIRLRYAGAATGATESIFVYTAEALGLQLLTPAEYMKAISEGTDPSAADKVTIRDQVSGRRIRVLVFNSQNSTPDVNALVDAARKNGIPVSAVTETLAPASATFQDWQTGQLQSLLLALGG